MDPGWTLDGWTGPGWVHESMDSDGALHSTHTLSLSLFDDPPLVHQVVRWHPLKIQRVPRHLPRRTRLTRKTEEEKKEEEEEEEEEEKKKPPRPWPPRRRTRRLRWQVREERRGEAMRCDAMRCDAMRSDPIRPDPMQPCPLLTCSRSHGRCRQRPALPTQQPPIAVRR